MSINVALEAFEGPLDLLLQLVRRSQISVWEIRIQSICDQFIAYTRQLEMVDVEQTGDFLVMASTLIRIKARLLLPKPELDSNETEEQIDEEEQLITRLLLYEGFREAAEELELLAQASLAQYPRGQEEELQPRQVGDPLAGITLLTLAVMAQQACHETEQHGVVHIPSETHTIAEQMTYIERLLTKVHNSLTFHELLSAQATKEEIVTTFLAVLELVRLHKITVWQETCKSQVMLTRRVTHAAI